MSEEAETAEAHAQPDRRVTVVAVVSAPALMPAVMRGKQETAPGDEIGESYAHWLRLLVVALGIWPAPNRLSGPAAHPFRSIAVPAAFVETLAGWLEHYDCETRISESYTADARMLAFWRRLPKANAS